MLLLSANGSNVVAACALSSSVDARASGHDVWWWSVEVVIVALLLLLLAVGRPALS